MLDKEQIETFHRNGYLNGGLALSEDEVDVLRAELERVIESQDQDDVAQPVRLVNLNRAKPEEPVWQVVNIWEASEPYRALLSRVKITEEDRTVDGRERATHLARSNPVQASPCGRCEYVASRRTLVADHRADDGGERLGCSGRCGCGERVYEYGSRLTSVGRSDQLRSRTRWV